MIGKRTWAGTILLFSTLFVTCTKQSNNNPELLPNGYSNQAIGKSAGDILSYGNYTSMSIQIQYMPGYALDSSTIDSVYDYLQGICNKPGGITISQSEINATGDTLNVSQVATLEARYRTAYTAGTNLALYVMVTNGYDTSANVLGFAYRNTSICLFGKDIFSNSGGAGQVTRVALESSVLEHEFGHLMGLVNLGSAMQTFHQDTAHGYHCNNSACLMYWEIETHSGIHAVSSKIPTLDAHCLADLIGNGGK